MRYYLKQLEIAARLGVSHARVRYARKTLLERGRHYRVWHNQPRISDEGFVIIQRWCLEREALAGKHVKPGFRHPDTGEGRYDIATQLPPGLTEKEREEPRSPGQILSGVSMKGPGEYRVCFIPPNPQLLIVKDRFGLHHPVLVKSNKTFWVGCCVRLRPSGLMPKFYAIIDNEVPRWKGDGVYERRREKPTSGGSALFGA